MLSIIVAIAKNYAIGKDNKLLWHLPEDLKKFKAITTGHTIIMGSKTFDSLGRVLPNRKHVVLTDIEGQTSNNEQVEFVYNMDDILKYAYDDEENFVIGGASMYRQLMPYCNKMYVTEINKEFEGDVYFPEIDKEVWKEIDRKKGLTDENNPYIYDYVVYVRK